MKVLHINQSDISGGAAISGYRLHQGLLAQGVDSKLLVGSVKTDDQRVAAVLRKPSIEIPTISTNSSYKLSLQLNALHQEASRQSHIYADCLLLEQM